MDKNSKLLPETIYQLIKLVKHSQWNFDEILDFLLNFVLVCREWHAVARPLTDMFEFINIDLTDCGVDRVSTLHEIFNIDASYAGMVRRLKIGIYDSGEGMDTLKKCGESLLALVKRFTGLTHFSVDPSKDEAWLCMGLEWFYALPIPVQECFTLICSLPSLQVLDLRGLKVPASIFVHHPGLEHLTLAYGYEFVRDRQSTTLTTPYTEGFAPLKSLTILLHGVMDKDEVVTHARATTLRQALYIYPLIFQNLTSFDALSLVEKIDSIRDLLHATKGTLEHFACGLTWQRLEGPHYNPADLPSLDELEAEFKLDFKSMSRLSSIELRYDSPKSWGFSSSFPVILSTLNTIKWRMMKKFKLVLIVKNDRHPLSQKLPVEALCSQVDTLIAQHIVASGKNANQRLDDIQVWVLHQRGYAQRPGPGTVRSGVEGRAQFPLLAAQSVRRPDMKLGCHIWEDGWYPEHEAYLMGGWKMTEKEERDCGIIAD